jgi:hypothetical protein
LASSASAPAAEATPPAGRQVGLAVVGILGQHVEGPPDGNESHFHPVDFAVPRGQPPKQAGILHLARSGKRHSHETARQV